MSQISVTRIRRPLIAGCLLCLGALAGCTPRVQGSSGGARKVGPKLERLVSQMHNPALSAEEKDAYWRSVRGTLVSATGQVKETEGSILLECRLEEPTAVKTACVRAYPAEKYRSTLKDFHSGQPLRVQGVLSDRRLDPEAADCPILFEVRDALIIIR